MIARTVLSMIAFAGLKVTAAERVTLIASSPGSKSVEAAKRITLLDGDSAELLTYAAPPLSLYTSLTGVIAGVQIQVPRPNQTQRVVIAGPAVITLTVGGPEYADPGTAYATFEIQRAGIATGPVPIPAEAGTTWQVVLEASSDLVNWTAVMPGDYPSSTPQRYFRTRLVKR